MKRQASIQNFFAKRQRVNKPVTEGLGPDVGCSTSTKLQSEIRSVGDGVDVGTFSEIASCDIDDSCTVTSEAVVEVCSSQVRKNIYDIRSYCQINYVRSLTNEDKISLLDNIWKPKSEYKFPSITHKNHTKCFQLK